MSQNPRDIILYPIYTEKTVQIGEDGRVVTFAVAKGTNKVQIKKAIEEIFDVKVEKVNVVNVRKKTKKVGRFVGKTAAVKKAIVTLQEGHTIDVL